MSARRLLSAILVAVALAAIGCGDDTNRVTLAELAQEQERFQGESIEACGLVRNFHERDSGYYVLEDEADNRVGVRPRSRVAAFVGRRLCVTGTFDVEPEFGRVIQVESVERPRSRTIETSSLLPPRRPVAPATTCASRSSTSDPITSDGF